MTKDEDTEDMAAVGRSLMDSIGTLIHGDPRFKHWAPAQDPAEIVFDIVNMMGDAQADAASHAARLRDALAFTLEQLRELMVFHDSKTKPCGEYGVECPISMGDGFGNSERAAIEAARQLLVSDGKASAPQASAEAKP